MFSEYLQDVYATRQMRDWETLGERMFLFDGVNPNLVVNGYSPCDRIMGCFPQLSLATPTPASGAGLSPGASIIYGIRRVVKIGGQEIFSSTTTADAVQLDFDSLACQTGHANLAAFQAISNGEFKITLGGNPYNILGVDTTGVGSLAEVAAEVQAAIRETTGNETVTVEYSTDHFVIKADKSVAVLAAVANGAGTNISATAGLKGTAGTPATAANLRAAIVIQQYEYLSTEADSRAKIYYQIFRNLPANNTMLFMVDELSQDEFANVAAAWATSTAYVAGDNVMVSNVLYVCLADHSSGATTEPGVGARWTDKWRTVLVGAPIAWITGTAYVKLDVRKVASILYTCKANHTSGDTTLPGVGADWKTYWAKHGSNVYTDKLADTDLPSYPYISLEESERYNFVPPCRYCRAFKGSLVMGGSDPYSEGRVSVESADLTKVKFHACPDVRAVDVGANLVIGDDPVIHTVTAWDPVENKLTITPAAAEAAPDVTTLWITATGYSLDDKRLNKNSYIYNCIQAHTSGTTTEPGVGTNWMMYWEDISTSYSLFRDPDTLYIAKPLPDDIEGWLTGTEVYPNFAKAKIKGIAVQSGICYVLREGGVESLEGSQDAGFSLAPIAGAPPGCASHATIADDRCFSPVLIYFSGEAGVVVISGGSYKIISRNIEAMIRDDVDHIYDGFTHGVYDPGRQMYHLWLFRPGEVVATGLAVPQLMLTCDMASDEWVSGELAASVSGLWQDSDGRNMVTVGIAGGVAKLADVSYDGADIKSVLAAGDMIASTGFTDITAAFPVSSDTVAGLCGLPICVKDATGENRARYIIKSNTATDIVIYGEWAVTPAAGWTYHVGAIRWYAETGEFAFSNSFEYEKKNYRIMGIGDCAQYDRWALDTAYALADKVDVAGDDRTIAAYRCIDAHLSTTLNQPGTGIDWATCWELITVPVTVSVRGTRHASEKIGSQTFDLKNSDKFELSRDQIGIRSRGFVVRLEGEGTEPLAILALSVQDTPVTNKR